MGQIPPVCKGLIVANVVVFVLQIFITRPSTPQDLQALIDRQRPPQRAKRGAEKKPRAEQEQPSKGTETQPHSADKPAAKSDSSGGKAASSGNATSDSDTASDEKTRHGKRRLAPEDDQEVMNEDDMDAAAAMLPTVSVVEEWFELDPSKVVRQGQIWRLLTCAFCHDRFSVFHILFNMLFLYWFGRMLEPLYGSKEFLLFYLTAAVVSSICFVALCLFTRDYTPAIGASGAVMAVVVLYAIHHPRERIYVFMLVPIEIRWLVLIYVIFDLHPVLLALAGTPQNTGIANAAHLGGAAFGYLYWRIRLAPGRHLGPPGALRPHLAAAPHAELAGPPPGGRCGQRRLVAQPIEAWQIEPRPIERRRA